MYTSRLFGTVKHVSCSSRCPHFRVSWIRSSSQSCTMLCDTHFAIVTRGQRFTSPPSPTQPPTWARGPPLVSRVQLHVYTGYIPHHSWQFFHKGYYSTHLQPPYSKSCEFHAICHKTPHIAFHLLSCWVTVCRALVQYYTTGHTWSIWYHCGWPGYVCT
jgi:hypothetical protein